MRRKLFLLAIILIAAATISSATIAYFSYEDKADNVIISGEIKIELIEKHGDVDFPAEGVKGILPGTTVSKIVSVKNTGTAAAWVRVKVTGIIKDEAGNPLPLETVHEGRPVPIMDIDFNTTDWTYKDGYYYYNKPLPVDTEESVTTALFKNVHFNKLMDNRYKNSTANIEVAAQAVQSDNNPIPEGGSVTDVKGWPADGTD